VPDAGHVPDELHVSRVLPLQVFSVVGVQTALHSPLVTAPLTQAPWLLQVWGVVLDPTHPVAPGVQTPTQALVTQAWLVHGTGEPHEPAVLHVCRPLPEQLVFPGTQDPEHAPPLHTYVHAVPVVGNFPVESQVTGMFPLQVLSTPGTQTAPHWPGVMEPLTHAPWLLHVCGVVTEHWVAPGEQLPVQAPLTHAWFVHACAAPHTPLESQVCTPLPAEAHFVAPGAQLPVQVPPEHAWFVHACAAPQVPVESQVCTPLLVEEHFTAPGEHTPVQAPFAHA